MRLSDRWLRRSLDARTESCLAHSFVFSVRSNGAINWTTGSGCFARRVRSSSTQSAVGSGWTRRIRAILETGGRRAVLLVRWAEWHSSRQRARVERIVDGGAAMTICRARRTIFGNFGAVGPPTIRSFCSPRRRVPVRRLEARRRRLSTSNQGETVYGPRSSRMAITYF